MQFIQVLVVLTLVSRVPGIENVGIWVLKGY